MSLNTASQEGESKLVVQITKVKCPFNCIDPSTGEIFEWIPRVANPVKCPNCSRKLARAGKATLLKRKEKRLSEGTEGGDTSADRALEGNAAASLSPLVNEEENKESRNNVEA